MKGRVELEVEVACERNKNGYKCSVGTKNPCTFFFPSEDDITTCFHGPVYCMCHYAKSAADQLAEMEREYQEGVISGLIDEIQRDIKRSIQRDINREMEDES